ncbi:MAG: transporter substrate-binding domain-containing protein [Proteobacteria bacterium]|nr:transporter substrate-binding domain-containing protein [Pseudomonadota bacterium]
MKKGIVLFLVLFVFSFRLSARSPEEIRKSGKLYAAFTEVSITNINYHFALEFAKHLGVELVAVPITWNDIFSHRGVVPKNLKTDPALSFTPDAIKKADFVCTSITILEWRKKLYDFAETFETAEVLVIPRKNTTVKEFEDLKGLTIGFLKNSSYETHLKRIDRKIGGGILFRTTKGDRYSQELLEKGTVDGIVIDLDIALKFVRRNPDFSIVFPVATPGRVGWALRKNNRELQEEIERFFDDIARNGILDRIFHEIMGVTHADFLKLATSHADLFDELKILERDLDEILESNKLVVALRERDLVYHRDGKKQFHHALAEEFAKNLGVELEIVVTPYFAKYWENRDGRIVKPDSYTPAWFYNFDIACEIITVLDWRKKKVDIVDFLPDVSIVLGRKETRIDSMSDLKRLKGVTVQGSTYIEELQRNGVENFYFAKANDLISEVRNKRADYTMLSNAVYFLPEFPDLEAKLVLGKVNQMGWALKKNQPKLLKAVKKFIKESKVNGLLDRLFEDQTGMTLNAAENFLNTLHDKFQTGHFPFVYYGLNDGLPQEHITSIFQDRDSYMWFGTHSGAVRYNGREMEVFGIDQGLKDNSVLDINQDEDGVVYFATSNGISIYKNRGMSTIFETVMFNKIYIDGENRKWFLGNSGIYTLNNQNRIDHLNDRYPNLPRKVRSLAWDKSGRNLYIASRYGLFRISGENAPVKIGEGEYHFVFIDANDRIWLSTDKGLYITDSGEVGGGAPMKRLNEVLKLSDAVIESIYQTEDGSWWLISDRRIFQVMTINHKAIVWDENLGLKNYPILSFMEDKENNLWFGFTGGLQKLTNRSLRIFHPDRFDNRVSGIVKDDRDRIWISSDNGLYHYRDKLAAFSPDPESRRAKYHAAILPDGSILLAGNKGLYKVDVDTLRVVAENRFPRPLTTPTGIFVSSKNEIFLLTETGGLVYYLKDFKAVPSAIENQATTLICQLEEYDSRIVGGNNTGLVVFSKGTFESFRDLESTVWSLYFDGYNLWVGTENGLGILHDTGFESVDVSTPSRVINAITPAGSGEHLWIGTNKGFSYFNRTTRKVEFSVDSRDGLLGNEIGINGLFQDHDNLLWIATYHGISIFDIRKRSISMYSPITHLKKIVLNGQESPILDRYSSYFKRISLKSHENNLVFEIDGLSFKDEKSIEYEFFMKGLEKEYQPTLGKENKAYYQNLPAGNYDFFYRTKGKDNTWSYFQVFRFEILNPFWKNWWFALICVSSLMLAIYAYIKLRLKALKNKTMELEKKVKNRTLEIRIANNKLRRTNADLSSLTTQLRQSNDQLNTKNRQIIDSINYASTIQSSILPKEEQLRGFFSEHFVIWNPRDIVGGDFYWFKQTENGCLVAVADCTGHGVPGAFMTMTANSVLNRIVEESPTCDPADILALLNQIVRITLRHDDSTKSLSDDGLDIGLCYCSLPEKKIVFAGARFSLIHCGNGKIAEIRGDRQSIGYQKSKTDYVYSNHEIGMANGSPCYMVTDGYFDQCGGEKRFSFGKKRLKRIIEENHGYPMTRQKEIYNACLKDYRQDHVQNDDITFLGFSM